MQFQHMSPDWYVGSGGAQIAYSGTPGECWTLDFSTDDSGKLVRSVDGGASFHSAACLGHRLLLADKRGRPTRSRLPHE